MCYNKKAIKKQSEVIHPLLGKFVVLEDDYDCPEKLTKITTVLGKTELEFESGKWLKATENIDTILTLWAPTKNESICWFWNSGGVPEVGMFLTLEDNKYHAKISSCEGFKEKVFDYCEPFVGILPDVIKKGLIMTIEDIKRAEEDVQKKEDNLKALEKMKRILEEEVFEENGDVREHLSLGGYCFGSENLSGVITFNESLVYAKINFAEKELTLSKKRLYEIESILKKITL